MAAAHDALVAVVIVVELIEQARDRVRPVPQVATADQIALLGVEEEHGAHQHGDDAGVDLARCDASEELAVGVAVGAGDGVDERLGGPADLDPELLGDVDLLVLGQAEQVGGGGVGVGGDAGCGEQGDERVGEATVESVQAGVDPGPAGDAGPDPDDEVLPAVRDQRQVGAEAAGSQRGSLHGGGRPAVVGGDGLGIEAVGGLGCCRSSEHDQSGLVGIAAAGRGGVWADGRVVVDGMDDGAGVELERSAFPVAEHLGKDSVDLVHGRLVPLGGEHAQVARGCLGVSLVIFGGHASSYTSSSAGEKGTGRRPRGGRARDGGRVGQPRLASSGCRNVRAMGMTNVSRSS